MSNREKSMRFIFFVLMAAVSSANHLQDMNDNFETMMKQLDPKVERPDTKEGHERIEVALDGAFGILEKMEWIANGALYHVRGCTPPCCTQTHSAEEWKNIYAAEIEAQQTPHAHSMALVYLDATDSVTKSAVELFIHDFVGAAFPLIDLNRMVTGSNKYRELTCDIYDRPQDPPGDINPWVEASSHIKGFELVTDIAIAARQKGQTFAITRDGREPERLMVMQELLKEGNCRRLGALCNPLYNGYNLEKKAYRMIVVWVFESPTEMIHHDPESKKRIWDILQTLDEFYLISNWVAQGEHPRLLAMSNHRTPCKTAEVENILNQIKANEKESVSEALLLFIDLNQLPMCQFAATPFQSGANIHQSGSTTVKSSIKTVTMQKTKRVSFAPLPH